MSVFCKNCIAFLYGYKQALSDILLILQKDNKISVELLDSLVSKELEIDKFLNRRQEHVNGCQTKQ